VGIQNELTRVGERGALAPRAPKAISGRILFTGGQLPPLAKRLSHRKKHETPEKPFRASHLEGAWCSAMTASSVSLAAVMPIRSKHSATMLFGAVSMLMRRSIAEICRRLLARAR
jgi:hypothetical protein